MKRVDWKKVIKKHFGDESFTIDELQEKSGIQRAKVYRALGYHTRAGTLKRVGIGRYALGDGEPEPVEKLPPFIINFLKELIIKFGDESFKIDQIIDATGGKSQSLHPKMHILAKGKFVERIGQGVYKVTDSGHNIAVNGFKEDRGREKEKVKAEPAPECIPSCVLMKMEKILGKDEMKNWVYATAITNEDCVTILEEAAVRSIAKTFRAQ